MNASQEAMLSSQFGRAHLCLQFKEFAQLLKHATRAGIPCCIPSKLVWENVFTTFNAHATRTQLHQPRLEHDNTCCTKTWAINAGFENGDFASAKQTNACTQCVFTCKTCFLFFVILRACVNLHDLLFLTQHVIATTTRVTLDPGTFRVQVFVRRLALGSGAVIKRGSSGLGFNYS